MAGPGIWKHWRLSPEVALPRMPGEHGSMGTLLKCKSSLGKSAMGPEILPDSVTSSMENNTLNRTLSRQNSL